MSVPRAAEAGWSRLHPTPLINTPSQYLILHPTRQNHSPIPPNTISLPPNKLPVCDLLQWDDDPDLFIHACPSNPAAKTTVVVVVVVAMFPPNLGRVRSNAIILIYHLPSHQSAAFSRINQASNEYQDWCGFNVSDSDVWNLQTWHIVAIPKS